MLSSNNYFWNGLVQTEISPCLSFAVSIDGLCDIRPSSGKKDFDAFLPTSALLRINGLSINNPPDPSSNRKLKSSIKDARKTDGKDKLVSPNPKSGGVSTTTSTSITSQAQSLLLQDPEYQDTPPNPPITMEARPSNQVSFVEPEPSDNMIPFPSFPDNSSIINNSDQILQLGLFEFPNNPESSLPSSFPFHTSFPSQSCETCNLSMKIHQVEDMVYIQRISNGQIEKNVVNGLISTTLSVKDRNDMDINSVNSAECDISLQSNQHDQIPITIHNSIHQPHIAVAPSKNETKRVTLKPSAEALPLLSYTTQSDISAIKARSVLTWKAGRVRVLIQVLINHSVLEGPLEGLQVIGSLSPLFSLPDVTILTNDIPSRPEGGNFNNEKKLFTWKLTDASQLQHPKLDFEIVFNYQQQGVDNPQQLETPSLKFIPILIRGFGDFSLTKSSLKVTNLNLHSSSYTCNQVSCKVDSKSKFEYRYL